MAKIAVIGGGISGLSAAWLLHSHHDITVFEKESRPGGHSRTITVCHRGRQIAVDTGFIVFNRKNYPNLTALFGLLHVPIKDSDMSFGLSVDNGGLEWGAKSINAVFGQRRNLLRPAFYKLIYDVLRFNAGAEREVERDAGMTLGELLSSMHMGDWFHRNYLLPMAGAIWSCPPAQMLQFPAQTFVRFFANHHLLSLTGQPQWLTVDGGAQVYVERLSAPFSDRMRADCGAVRVCRRRDRVEVSDTTGRVEAFDEVIFACHADEALACLADPAPEEREALGAIGYQRNHAVLHSDSSIMPRAKPCWASWVYHSNQQGSEPALSVTYWMNSLQGIDPDYPLFVTLNPTRQIAPEHIFDRHMFHHPVFDFAALRAQDRLKRMQGRRNTWFCGAHMGHGFHEDGLVSAMAVAEGMGIAIPWKHEPQIPAASPAPSARPRPAVTLRPIAGRAAAFSELGAE